MSQVIVVDVDVELGIYFLFDITMFILNKLNW